MPGVKIEKVEVDKLVSYFEYTYMNVTNHLHLNQFESKIITWHILALPELNVLTLKYIYISDHAVFMSVYIF